jgi:tetratricopeptide (TPR) repeat protein
MAIQHRRQEAAWTWFWPGLPALWHYGSVAGLFVALFFSILLAVVVLATAVWPNLLRMGPKAVVCFSVVCYWAFFVHQQIRSQLRLRKELRSKGDRKHLFRTAQTEYLKRNWDQAEEYLFQLLEVHPDDDDARLLLATMFRRVGRVQEASLELDSVERSTGSATGRLAAGRKWSWEIREERRLLASPKNVDNSKFVEAA